MNATQIKICLFLLMILNHFTIVFKNEVSTELYLFIGYLSRAVAPMFWYLSVESYYKTKHKKRYLYHLFGFALFMSLGNYALNALFVNQGLSPMPMQFNIFWSIAIGVGFIGCLENTKNSALTSNKQSLFILLASALWGCLLFVEGDLYAMVAYPIFYWFWKRKAHLYLAYAAACLCLLGFTYYTQHGLFQEGQYAWLMISAIAWFWVYNGQRGPNTSGFKYFFYMGYPLHVWLLYSLWALKN